MKKSLRRLVLALLLLGGSALAAAAEVQGSTPLPGASIYHLPVTLERVGHGEVPLVSLAGSPVVITMFYSSCLVICPMLTVAMQKTALALDPSQRAQVRFVMVSLDAERDTVAKLADFAADHHIDTDQWVVAHASAGDVRQLAAALGIRYRRLPDGNYSHSSALTLLDARGVPNGRTDDLSAADAALLAQIRALLH